MAAPWDENETRILAENIVDGLPVQSMKELIPIRGMGGIIQKAQQLDYGVKTSKVDGITRFYPNRKSRSRESRISTENDEPIGIVDTLEDIQFQQAVLEHIEPEADIVPYDGFSANELAINILRDNGLDANPDIIRYLSIHILGGEL